VAGGRRSLPQRQFVSCGREAGVRAPRVVLAAAPNLMRWLAFAVFAGSIALSAFVGATALSVPVIDSYQVGIRLGSSYLLSLTAVRFDRHRSEIGAGWERIVPGAGA